MADYNPTLMPMEEHLTLSVSMSPRTPEEKLGMRAVPYQELIGKLLSLAIATRPNTAYAVSVLCRFMERTIRMQASVYSGISRALWTCLSSIRIPPCQTYSHPTLTPT